MSIAQEEKTKAPASGVTLPIAQSDVTGLTAALDAKAPLAWTPRTVTGTSATLASSDLGHPVICTNAGAVAVGVPGGIALGVYPVFAMGGAATQLTFAGSGGLTVTAPPGLTLKSRTGASGAMLCINVLSATSAVLSGDVAVV
jgi:hypothetical protein